MTAQPVGAPSLPDLYIHSLTLTSSTLARDREFTLHYNVLNYSSATAGATVSGIYLSTDSTITTSDRLLTTDPVETLYGYGLGSRGVHITIPDTIAFGNYYIGVIADYGNAVAESNETNNSWPGTSVWVVAAQPDIRIQNAPQLSTSWVIGGESASLTYVLENIGTDTAGPSLSRIYLSNDNTITTSDTLLTTDAVAALAAGSRSTESVSVTLPGTLTPGYYYIGVIADYNNAIAEGSETNNVSPSDALYVAALPQPDLDVSYGTSLSSSTVVKGWSVTLSYWVTNYGSGKAGASTSGIYLSTDSTISTSDTLLGTDAVAAMASGTSSSESVNITIPDTLATGTFYIGVIADYDNVVTESNETNNPSNALTLSVIEPVVPDLDIVYAPTLDSAWVLKGGTVKLDYTIEGPAVGWTGSSVTGIYLSTDGTITTSDTLLATDPVAAITQNGWTHKAVSVVIPDTIAAGSYYIGAVADYNNAVAEKDEGNNSSMAAVLNVMLPDDYAGSTSTTGTVAVGGSATGNIEKPQDVDWFRVELLGGVDYTIEVKGASSGSGTLSNPDFTLYSSTGSSIATIYGGGAGTDARYAGFSTGNLAGTYYVGVKQGSSGTTAAVTGSYVVSVGVTQDDYTAGLDTSGNLAIGGTISGNIDYTGDRDYFRVQLDAGTAYKFDLRGASSGGGTLSNPALTLHDAHNTAIRWDDNGGRAYLGSSTDAQIVYIPRETGAYYVGATGSESATGNYQLTAQTLSSDYYIQGLLAQPNVRWNAGAPMGTPVNVTYSFPTTLPSEYSPDDIRGYHSFSGSQKAAAVQALSVISTYANITFTEVSGSDGQIRFGTCFQGNILAGVTIPYTSGDSLTRADVALANDYPANSNLSVGTTGYETLVHEIGHALGLKHPGDYNAIGAAPTPPYLPTSQDTSAFTVETYNNAGTPVKSLMPFDIAALQYLYGANLATRGGNDNYTLSRGSAYVVWDSAGIDTLNASTLTSEVVLDLNPGSVSYDGYVGTGKFLSPIVAIAFGSTIENAAGGSESDELLGNAADNRLTGNGGDDRIVGGAGIDVAVYSGNRSNYTLTDTGNPVLGYTVAAKTGTEGTDNLFDVERLKFADTSVAIDMDGSAGSAARIIGALFGKQYLQTKEYVGAGLQLFDAGQSMEQVAQCALGTGLFKQLAGSGSNSDFVKLVYQNVFGSAPGANDLDNYVRQLDSGEYTQASLAVAAAETDLNKANIDLVGLAQTGIEYA